MLVDTRERRPFFRLTLASTSPKRWRVLGRMGKTLCARAGVHPNMALLRNTTSADNILGMFDHETGEQTKDADKNREVEP